MSQTSSPTLRYDLVGSMHEVTSGGGREGFIFQFQPDTRKFSTFFSSPEKFLEQSFTPLPFQSMDYISNQGILSDSLLYRLYLEITASYSKNILFQSWQSQSSRIGGIPYHRVGVDVSTLLERQDSNSPQLPQFEIIRWIRTKTSLPQDRIARLAGVTRQTLYNWEKGEPILDHNRQRLLQIKDVLERASSQHPTPISLVTWLDTPRGAEGYTPAQLLERNEIDKARLFAISSPSPHLKRAQSWVRRSVPEAFKPGEEHYNEALPPLEEDGFIEDLTSLENDGR
jgi:DNA-binding transcriptional regulator YiaG